VQESLVAKEIGIPSQGKLLRIICAIRACMRSMCAYMCGISMSVDACMHVGSVDVASRVGSGAGRQEDTCAAAAVDEMEETRLD
jgi:hypothetical protein